MLIGDALGRAMVGLLGGKAEPLPQVPRPQRAAHAQAPEPTEEEKRVAQQALKPILLDGIAAAYMANPRYQTTLQQEVRGERRGRANQFLRGALPGHACEAQLVHTGELLVIEKLAATRVLLLGAGTLGCAVARSLVAWGVTRVTLVDGGTVAYSNPARQWLYTVDDAKAQAPKAAAAAAALRRIAPGSAAAPAAFVGKKLTIAMPGHALPAAGTPAGDAADAEVHALDALVADADCVFLLTDTRESRWLPTVVAAARGTLLVNVALGLDTFVVQRHGHGGNGLGCYFCGDVAAPTNSTRDRTLDQQCTVSRPGLAPAAAALAVELLVALLHHPREGAAPADPATPPGAPLPGNRPLGLVPHSIRGFLTHYATVLPTTPAFDRCAACAPAVVAAYRDRGVALVRDVGADPGLLERLSGLADLKGAVDGAAWAEADEF